MIRFNHVYKTYPGPTHALRNVDLEIQKGEFVFLVGPSGAGKSTLFKMICGYDTATSGEIEVSGFKLNTIDQKTLPTFRRRIGVVFQDFKLLKDKTIFENVALPLKIRNEKESVITKKVNDLLNLVGLKNKAHQYPEFISGGEQQRAAIARAIIHQPEVLIADEPTGNLDPKLSEEIMDLFEKACAQGSTVIIATHDLAMVERRQKRKIELAKGEIIKDGL